MNKTVNINLSGIIFHIEEDAYNKLHSYLSTIKGYFSESEGRDEIMSDIENRIAEMLSEKVSDRKQVVLMADVDYVISVMGKPEDFAGEKAEGNNKEQPTYSTSNKRRRVFRDPDNKILGGVCSGIGNYFNIDPIWLRLALVVSFFAFGTGFLLYIVLWVLIPEAKTSAEKLEMRGEDVNFSNIGKKVEEEMHTFGKKMENWGEEVKKTATSGKARDFVDKLAHFLSSLFGMLFRVVGKVFGLFFIIIGLIFLVCILSSLFGGTGLVHIDGDTFSIRDGFSMFFVDSQQEMLASIAIFLFVCVPVIMLVYGGVKLLLGIRTKNRFIGISAGILWFAGLVLTLILGNQVANQFSDEATSKNTMTLIQPKCDTLFLKVKGEPEGEKTYEHKHDGRFHFKFKSHSLVSSDSANLNFGFPDLDIVKSETNNYEVVIYGESRGKDREEALDFAKNILYDLTQRDSLVEFAPYFSVPKDEKWRAQQVHIEVRVPKGKVVYIGKSMKNIIYDVKNETNTWDGDMIGRRWIMGSEELRCLDCEGLNMDHGKKRKRHVDIEVSDDDHDTPAAVKPVPEPPTPPMPPAKKESVK